VSAAASNDVTNELDFVGELHCDLRVDDLDVAVTWYRETLGFEVSTTFARSAGRSSDRRWPESESG
jgi:catechol-2,3-dioxygenase